MVTVISPRNLTRCGILNSLLSLHLALGYPSERSVAIVQMAVDEGPNEGL